MKQASRTEAARPPGPIRSRIRAVVRLRPVMKDDNGLATMLRMSPEVCVHVNADGQRVLLKRDAFESREFRVDYALGPTTGQQELYQLACKDIVTDYLQGYNGFVMAYGQVIPFLIGFVLFCSLNSYADWIRQNALHVWQGFRRLQSTCSGDDGHCALRCRGHLQPNASQVC